MLLAGLDAETMNASTTGATISDGIIDRLCSNASFGLVCMPFEEHERIWFLTTEVALTAVIALLGICGNALAAFILCKDKKPSTTNTILEALAIWDIIYLALCVVNNTTRYYLRYMVMDPNYEYSGEAISKLIVSFLVPMQVSSLSVLHLLTLMVAVDRLLAVCQPLTMRHRSRTTIAIVLVSLVVPTLHIPLVFEYKSNTYAAIDRNTFLKDSKFYKFFWIVQYDKLLNNYAYQIIYKIIFEVLLRDLVPVVLLILFNIKLYNALRRVRKRYQEMTKNGRRLNDISLTRTIVITVAVFTLTNIPHLTNKLLLAIRQIIIMVLNEDKLSFMTSDEVGYKLYYTTASNLTIAIAMAMNFVIYVVFAKKFTKIFVMTFCCKGKWFGRFRDVQPSTTSEDATAINTRARVELMPRGESKIWSTA